MLFWNVCIVVVKGLDKIFLNSPFFLYWINWYRVYPWRGWVRQRYRVSYVTGSSHCDWLAVWQGLLSLRQLRVRQNAFFFFCFFNFIHFPLSPLSLSFISSTISSISLLPFFGIRHKMTNKCWCVVKPQHNQSITELIRRLSMAASVNDASNYLRSISSCPPVFRPLFLLSVP